LTQANIAALKSITRALEILLNPKQLGKYNMKNITRALEILLNPKQLGKYNMKNITRALEILLKPKQLGKYKSIDINKTNDLTNFIISKKKSVSKLYKH